MKKVEVTLEIDQSALGYYQALASQRGVSEEELMSRTLYAAALALRYLEPPGDQYTRTR